MCLPFALVHLTMPFSVPFSMALTVVFSHGLVPTVIHILRAGQRRSFVVPAQATQKA